MARNRKSQSVAIRFGPALKALLLCLLIGGSGVGYVWQKEQISNLGVQIKNRERALDSRNKQNEFLWRQLAKMRTPQFLEMRIKDLNLGLVRPQMEQILVLPEPSADLAKPAHEPQFAVRGDRAVLDP